MSRLIGRNSEKGELLNYINMLASGKGSLVLVAGEAGVGKTAFIEDALTSFGGPIFISRSSEDGDVPYSLFTKILREELHRNGKIDVGHLSKYLPLILPELGESKTINDPAILIDTAASAVISLSAFSPVIIWFDDIHWADNTSFDILLSLTDKLASYPLLIITSYRTDEISRDHRIRKFRTELRRRRKLSEISLSPLNPIETKTLTESILKNSVSDLACTSIFEHTQGIPLFVEELIHTLKENKLLKLKDGLYYLEPNSRLPIPENILDSVLLRLNSLSDEAGNLLKYASLYGIEFPISFLNTINNHESALDELLAKGWLTESESVISFKHALIRQAVKYSINWQQRSLMHRQIAEYLENTGGLLGVIAEHWMAANENNKAREALINSIESYCRMYAYKDAAERASKALEMWPSGLDLETKVIVLKKYAECARLSGNFDDAIKALKEALSISEEKADKALLAEIYSSLGAIYSITGSGELSVKARIAAAELFDKSGLILEAATEYLLAAGRSTSLIQLDNALALASKAIEEAERINNVNIKSRAMGITGNILSKLAKYDEGKEIAESALKLALDANDTLAASEIYRQLASTLEYASDYSGARSVYVNAFNFCLNHGEEINARVCLSCMTYIFFKLGEWKKSLEVCKDVIKSEHTPKTSLPVGYGMTGVILSLRGETKSAIKNLNESLTLSIKYNVTICELIVLWGIAILQEAAGDNEAAESSYISMINKWHETQDMHDIVPCLMWAAVFFNERDLKKELTRTIEILSRITASTSNPEAASAFSFALAEADISGLNISSAIERYKQALNHVEKLEIPLEQLFIEYRYSLALIKSGDTNSAIKYLKRAYRTARNLGTRPLASQIASSLESIGFSAEESRDPESVERVQKFGLTQRQYEILELIGEGLTNKEIAIRLFLSNRTVDMHVSNILQRLNCRTRTEAISKIKTMETSTN